VLDLAAWAGVLRERGCRRTVLVGHSLGGVKCAYWMAQQRPDDITALVAVSAPRIVYEVLSTGPRGAEFLRDYATAQQLVAQGQGQQLMEIAFPLPYLVTGAGFLDKYGPEQRYDILAALPLVAVPWLAVYADQELDGAAFAGLPEACRQRGGHVVIVQGADHFYVGAHRELADHIERWLRNTLPSADSA
jgi:pimeloyl-ACP methyl ester carboxylesterase